jgi:uroporphyrin-III C-methyltransferase/precorrin-2 dehydrogenase/sirohydrochlorin ferrochelatase
MIETVASIPTEAPSGRMKSMARLPVFLSLHGKHAIIAGNGPAVVWKTELLSAAGALLELEEHK